MFPRICCSTCPLEWPDTFILVPHQFGGYFLSATCPMNFNEMNCATYHGDKISTLYVPATCHPSVHYTCFCQCNISLYYVLVTWPLVSAHLYSLMKKKKQKTNKPTAIMTPLKRVPALLSYLTNSEEHRAGFKGRTRALNKISIV